MKISSAAHEARIAIQLGLTHEDIEERRSCLGASDANIILSGVPERVHKLWRVKRGLEQPEDLSNVLAVQMGIWTEEFNLMWYESQTGNKVVGRRSRIAHPSVPYVRATLDGQTTTCPGTTVVVEAKHVGPFGYALEHTISNYAPQLAVQMACANVSKAHLSVFSGSAKWELGIVDRDPLYEVQVFDALHKFWDHVQSGTEPVALPSPRGMIPIALLRTVDMSTNNAWVAAEEDYLAHEKNAKRFEEAKSELKSLMSDDIGEIIGRRLKLKRDKSGSQRFSKR